MALGDLITGDYQYEFNGYKFGSGTGRIVETAEGIFGLPSARADDEDAQDDHGAWSGTDLLPGRTMQFAINIDSTPTLVDGEIALAETAFQVSKRKQLAGIIHGLVSKRPGKAARVSWAKARRCSFPSNYETGRGLARGAVELFAPDVRWYSLAEQSQNIVLNANIVTGNAVFNNAGNFDDGVHPYITITGPAENPRIANAQDDNRSIKIDVVLGAVDTLVIDVATGEVFVNGALRGDVVRNDNQWFVLLPGNNTLTYQRTAGGASGAQSTMNVKWRHGYTGA